MIKKVALTLKYILDKLLVLSNIEGNGDFDFTSMER